MIDIKEKLERATPIPEVEILWDCVKDDSLLGGYAYYTGSRGGTVYFEVTYRPRSGEYTLARLFNASGRAPTVTHWTSPDLGKMLAYARRLLGEEEARRGGQYGRY